MGTAVSFVVGVVQDLAVRFQRQRFDRDFTETQFLLNTAGGSDDHLAKGVAKAREMLLRPWAPGGGPARALGLDPRLATDEQRLVREQAVELIMLEARARRSSRRSCTARRATGVGRSNGRSPASTRPSTSTTMPRPRSSTSDRDTAMPSANPPGPSATACGPSQTTPDDLPRLDPARHHPAGRGDTCRRREGTAGRPSDSTSPRSGPGSSWATATTRRAGSSRRPAISPSAPRDGPAFAWTHFNRGLALARAGRLLDARDAYDRALRLEPKFVEAMVDRALVELELNQLDQALSDLNRASRPRTEGPGRPGGARRGPGAPRPSRPRPNAISTTCSHANPTIRSSALPGG